MTDFADFVQESVIDEMLDSADEVVEESFREVSRDGEDAVTISIPVGAEPYIQFFLGHCYFAGKCPEAHRIVEQRDIELTVSNSRIMEALSAVVTLPMRVDTLSLHLAVDCLPMIDATFYPEESAVDMGELFNAKGEREQ